MIIVLKPNVTQSEIDHISERLSALGLTAHVSRGKERTIIGAIGDDRVLESLPLSIFP